VRDNSHGTVGGATGSPICLVDGFSFFIERKRARVTFSFVRHFAWRVVFIGGQAVVGVSCTEVERTL
jgi:hypothetical protein